MSTACSFFRRLFNWIPGPAIAKFTRFWATSHHLDGSYDETVQELHLRHGSLVQVGPTLYSLSDQEYFDTLYDLEAGSYSAAPAAVSSFQQLLMSNIFRNEHLIDACNEKLFAFFTHSAQIGAPINLSNIIARYAYDVMIATTTGQPAGFLDTEPDPAKVDRALKDWRFYAILYGSYLRYHPIIAAVRKFCGMDKIAQDERFKMTPEAAQPSESTDEQPTHAKHGTKTSAAPIEARIALSLAGADPTMSLILKAIQQMFTEEGLLDRLRDEITAADLSYPIPFQQLISRKDRLPLMLGLLLDCLHAQSGRAAKAYTVPKAGISIGNAEVPEGATILLEPTPIPHVNPPELGGDRWLNSSLAPDLKHHLFALITSNTKAQHHQQRRKLHHDVPSPPRPQDVHSPGVEFLSPRSGHHAVVCLRHHQHGRQERRERRRSRAARGEPVSPLLSLPSLSTRSAHLRLCPGRRPPAHHSGVRRRVRLGPPLQNRRQAPAGLSLRLCPCRRRHAIKGGDSGGDGSCLPWPLRPWSSRSPSRPQGRLAPRPPASDPAKQLLGIIRRRRRSAGRQLRNSRSSRGAPQEGRRSGERLTTTAANFHRELGAGQADQEDDRVEEDDRRSSGKGGGEQANGCHVRTTTSPSRGEGQGREGSLKQRAEHMIISALTSHNISTPVPTHHITDTTSPRLLCFIHFVTACALDHELSATERKCHHMEG